MGEYIEFVVADRSQDLRSDIRRVKSRLPKFDEAGKELSCWACGVWCHSRAVARWPVPSAGPNMSSHETRADHSHADTHRRNLFRQPLRHVDHREFAC